jgi:hypothetical protein
MAGFSSNDTIIDAMTNGQNFRYDWNKQFNPTTAATANEAHILTRGNGNPGPDSLFDVGANLTFIPVTDATSGAASIPHGGNVSPSYKSLLNGSAFTAAGTTTPGMLCLVDLVGYYRKTSVTTTTAESTTNTLSAFSNFTVGTNDILTHTNINLMPYTRIQVSTTVTLPTGLSAATDYYVIKLTDTTCKVATSYANAVAGTAVSVTAGTGSGTHTINTLLPRYTNGAGLQSIFFNPAATALGAATPNLSLGYTNSAQTGSRATPGVLPVGKTAASNTLILYSGATGAGKYNYTVPLQAGDAGIAQIDTIRNSTSYVSGTYTVALVKELARFPITTLGVTAERDFLNQIPSLPRIYDGAALYWVWCSGVNTPTNSAFNGHLQFLWN